MSFLQWSFYGFVPTPNLIPSSLAFFWYKMLMMLQCFSGFLRASSQVKFVGQHNNLWPYGHMFSFRILAGKNDRKKTIRYMFRIKFWQQFLLPGKCRGKKSLNTTAMKATHFPNSPLNHNADYQLKMFNFQQREKKREKFKNSMHQDITSRS